jgi:hypothetical protein
MSLAPIRHRSEYYAYHNMKTRCYNVRDKSYKYYGARGIKICDRWLQSFKNFLDDIGHKPGPEYSLDRKNNDGNYEPKNCRWATAKEQSRNTRRQQAHRIKKMWGDARSVPFRYEGPDLFA